MDDRIRITDEDKGSGKIPDKKELEKAVEKAKIEGRKEVVQWLISQGIFYPDKAASNSPIGIKLTEWGLEALKSGEEVK